MRSAKIFHEWLGTTGPAANLGCKQLLLYHRASLELLRQYHWSEEGKISAQPIHLSCMYAVLCLFKTLHRAIDSLWGFGVIDAFI